MKKYIFLIIMSASALSFIPAQKAISMDKPGKYVGSTTCKECHMSEYKGWKSTLHPYKFQPVSPDAVVGDFEKNNTISIDDKTIQMTKKGDDFFVTTPGPDGKVSEYKVKYLIGGFWKQHYVTEFANGELHILPPTWIVETQSWETTKYWPDTIYQNSCAGCHNTGVQVNHDLKTNTYKTTWSETGVSCESCHGPGERHVASKDQEKFETIVNPAKIPDLRRGVMVCGSCHNRGSSPDGKYDYPHGYTPGDHLNFMFVEKPKLHPDDSTMANRQQYVDWKKSGHAREGIACWDCHYAHQKGSANKYQTKLPGSSLCRSCHQVENTGVHGIHSVNNCIGCHMPPVGKRATKGDVHSHRLTVISPEASIKNGGIEKQPNSCNLCHYHANDAPEELLNILLQVKKGRKAIKTSK